MTSFGAGLSNVLHYPHLSFGFGFLSNAPGYWMNGKSPGLNGPGAWEGDHPMGIGVVIGL
jgi:hypothetical protein